MRALLLAAGFGTRLRPVTNTIPKCLVEINGRPLLDYWLDLLSHAGIGDILVNTHYLSGTVDALIERSTYPANITTVHEPALLGTGGTLLRNRAFFRGEAAMLIHADNLSMFDVKAFVGRYEERPPGVDMTMMTFETNTPESCGIVELDRRGLVTAFHEKKKNPPGNLANGAVYIVAPAVVDFLAGLDKETIDFSSEVIPKFLRRINTFHNDVYHRDIGTIDSLREAQTDYAAALARISSPSRSTGQARPS